MESDVGALVRGPEPRAVRSRPDVRYADVGRLVITCPDRPGIVAAVSQFLFEAGANITESQQYSTDPFGGTFFQRLEFHLDGLDARSGELAERFAATADRFSMRWKLTRAADLKRVAIMVSRTDHSLQEILWRAQSGELRADIRMIISNHTDAGEAAAWWGLPFHHVPVTPETKDAAETAQLRLLANEIDLVILARYMQILSPRFLSEFTAPIINIHHSFLPAFAGADPYRRAAARGVKLIGATAHYVTAELDQGPIIEQDVRRVSHRDDVDALVQKGRELERQVLTRAVRAHLQRRVLVTGNKTIVFG